MEIQCEKCGDLHDGSFGSGKYCGRSCANSRSFSTITKEKQRDANKEIALKKGLNLRTLKFCSTCNKKISYENKSGICLSCKGVNLKKNKIKFEDYVIYDTTEVVEYCNIFKFKIKCYGTDEFNDALLYCIKNSNSMSEAAYKLGVKYDTFKKYAIKMEVFKTNQGGKGTHKKPSRIIYLQDIISGKTPYHSCSTLRKRLIKYGLKEEKCEECGITIWNGKKIIFELHHVDGNRDNHKFENLSILCPNCHSQTERFRRNKNI